MQAESEQTNSALALGVCIDRDLNVRSAGGYLVQVCVCERPVDDVCQQSHCVACALNSRLVHNPPARIAPSTGAFEHNTNTHMFAHTHQNNQVLPFCSDETLDQLEANLGTLPSMTQLLNAGLSPQDITERILAGLGSSSTADAIVPQ